MKMIKKMQWIILFLFVFLCGISFAQEPSEIERMIKQKSDFTVEDIQKIMVLLERADKGGVPVEILVKRIEEGLARKADSQKILEVLTNKIEKLALANNLIQNCSIKGMKIGNINYSQRVLGELLEKGLLEADFKELFNLGLLRDMDLENLVKTSKIFIELIEAKIPVGDAKEVIALSMVKKMSVKQIDKTARLFLEAKAMHVKTEEAREIIIDGINKGWSLFRMRENIREISSSEKIRGEREIFNKERRENEGGKGLGENGHEKMRGRNGDKR